MTVNSGLVNNRSLVTFQEIFKAIVAPLGMPVSEGDREGRGATTEAVEIVEAGVTGGYE